jgi:Fur family ferric uptake transcriptional regulator
MENRKHILKDYGLRVTEARLTVLEAFLHSCRVFDHTALLAACGGRVDRVTLYRTLHAFHEHNILYKVPSSSGVTQYGLRGIKGHAPKDAPLGENHLHLICQGCGKIISVSPFLLPVIPLPKGFQRQYVDMIVNGKCVSCVRET